MKKYFDDSFEDSIDVVLLGVVFVLLAALFVTAVVTVPQIAERQTEVVEATDEEAKAPQNGARENMKEKAKEKDGVFIFEQPARTLLIDDILF